MQIIKPGLLATTFLVAACSNHHNTYQQQAGQTAQLKMPTGVSLKKQEPYYPVPKNINTHIKTPSLLPPDSGLEKQSKKTS